MADTEKKTAAKKPKKTAAKSSPKKNDEKDFFVVGLGASAGGVKAMQEFFAAMPANSGMAFVVILHLSPDHESNLAQILQAQTTMPVVQVNKVYEVVPNHVYVIPPNRDLKMVDGIVRPAKQELKQGTRAAIDIFFRTLAEAYGQNAVCIVMSGTGADGASGLKRIKESNGFAIVQAPEDAEYDQMPRHSIITGLADWILPVRQMPEKLIGFRDSSERLHLTGNNTEKVAQEINAEESLREILTILRVRTGHDFSSYKTPTLIRRIARHLQIHELEDIPAYLNFLRDNPEEIQFLQRNLLINVTNFFRDKEAFATFEKAVVPRLFAGRTRHDTVRVWSAGCASGEEAFSIAMILQEFAEKLTDAPKFQIFATDVDDEAIQQARENSYPETIEADVSPERLRYFFVRDGNRYRVKKELRECVLFAPHNILRDPPFSKLDLISCRNLLIYLHREAQERVMQIFHFALNFDGFLFLGSSESAESVPELFEAVNKKHRLYHRRGTGNMYQPAPRMPVLGSWQINQQSAHDRAIERVKAYSLGEVHYKLLENFAPPSVLVNQDFDVVYMSESVGRYLRFSGGEPTNNILKLVSRALLPDLRAALFIAQRERQSSEFPNIRTIIDGKETFVSLIVRAVNVEATGGDFLLVIFDESSQIKPRRAGIKKADKEALRTLDKDDAMATIVRRLEDELQRAKANLRATVEQHEISIEELKASNEELQAINEELRSASEELETSKEELQSVNEELVTVNHELKDKIEDAARTNSDLQNLLSSTDIATIFLDRKLRIKRYSPLIEKLFNITITDIGRPLEHFTHQLDYKDLTKDAAEVLQSLKTIEREISDNENRCFLTRFVPYRTTDDRSEGVVLNFLEITQYKLEEKKSRAIQENYHDRFKAEVAARTAELDESREQFISLVENTPDVITRWDKNLKLIYANKAFEDKTGVANETLLGKNNLEMGQPAEIAKPYMDSLQKVFNTGESIEHFNTFPTPHGELIYHSRIVPEKNRKGKVESVLAIARDITGSKNPENALSSSEIRLRIAVESADMGIWEWDLVDDKVYWNEHHYRLLGAIPDDRTLTSADFLTYLHPEEQERISEKLKAAIDGKILFDEIFRVVLKDGSTRWISGYGRVSETDQYGKPTRMNGVMFDITDRKQAQEVLQKSESQLQLILESTKDYAIITYDLQRRITRWNQGAQRIFGYGEKEMLGETGNRLFTPEDRADQIPEKEFRVALEKGRAEDERFHLRKDGTRFYASGVMQPMRDGEVEGFVKIARDQTQRITIEAAVKEKETLRRMISTQEDERRRIARDIHDHFGQQLTALRIKLNAIQKSARGKKLSEEIADVQKATAALDAEVDFIAWELRPAALDDLGLRVTLQNFVREWSHHSDIETEFHTSGIGKKRLSFETETNLYRIAQEALNNIYKHAKATRVDVILEHRASQIVLIIADNGIGFDMEDKITRRKGIGLVGMSERANIIGGEIEFESAADTGMTVFVRVPAVFIEQPGE